MTYKVIVAVRRLREGGWVGRFQANVTMTSSVPKSTCEWPLKANTEKPKRDKYTSLGQPSS